jgi:chromosome segregation ATPase
MSLLFVALLLHLQLHYILKMNITILQQNKPSQTLAGALGVKTQVVDFKKNFGDNPIHKGHSAAKYLLETNNATASSGTGRPQGKKMKKPKSALADKMGALGFNIDDESSKSSSSASPSAKKPQTLAEALGVSTKVVNFSAEFGDNPIREGHSAAKYLDKPQTLAEALGVKTQVVNFHKSFGSNPIHKGHSAAKYLAAAQTKEKQQYLADMKNRSVGKHDKPNVLVGPPSDPLGVVGPSDPLGTDNEADITEAKEKLGDLKGDVYELFNVVQRSVEGGRKHIAEEALTLQNKDSRYWETMARVMDQLQESSARETVLNKGLTESMSALILERDRLNETESKFSEAQSRLELQQHNLLTAMGRVSNLEAERVQLQRGTKDLDAVTNKLYDAQKSLLSDSMSLQEAKANHSKKLQESSAREAKLQKKATAAQKERDEAQEKLKEIETALQISRVAFKQARVRVSELQVGTKELEERTNVADAEGVKVGRELTKLRSQGQQQSTQSIDLAGQFSGSEIRASNLRKELNKSKAAFEVAKRQREESESRVQHTEALLDSHKELVQTARQKIGTIESEVKKLRKENHALDKQSQVLLQERQSLESQVQEVRDAMAGHVNELEVAATREAKMHEQVTSSQCQLADAQGQLKERELALATSEAALKTARGRVEQLQTRLQQLEGRMQVLEEERSEMVQERSAFQNQSEQQQEQLATLSQDVEASELEAAALRKELDESMAALKSTKSLQMETETRAEESGSLLSTHRQDLEAAHGRIAALEEEMETLRGQLSALDTVTAKLSEARESLENESKLLQETEESAAEKLVESAAREVSLKEEAEMVQTKRQKAEVRGKELEETLSTQIKDMEAASDRIDAMKDEFDDVTVGRTRDMELHYYETKSTKKWAALSLVGVAVLFAVAVSVAHIPVHTTVTGDIA